MAAVEYDPKKTTINEDKLADWLKDKVTGDLEEVPGIGPANKATLEGQDIENTYQLIGKYLTFKKGTVKEHQDAMFAWLKSIGVNSGRNNVVLALGEKCDIFMQGIYDSSIY
mmetsp:Transcript_80135/g.156700  ORF Transcript_80135/g.156700 Transcript_80135/m.156700 type:complete len:112 (+) Transcript_80135:71-406(+)